ncbi:hypothetical protein [Niabella sp.]|uniref:hypothetical protein n=1 Tax=Niabella sp. TaxID=1962976 RepID=UPI00261092E1|nr:hypothetical protein [Niabella sp.]
MRHCLLPLTLICLCLFTNAQPQKIYLNPKSPATENQSHFVDSVRFITLEPQAGVTISSWDNIALTKNYVAIIQYSARQLLLYTYEGRFIKKISYKKLGEGFYPAYDKQNETFRFYGSNRNYSLTPKDEIKIELNYNDHRNQKYYKKYTIDLKDPNFEIKKGSPTEYEVNNIYHLNGDYYLRSKATASKLYKDSVGYEIKLYKDHKLVKQYFPYNQVKDPRFLYSVGYSATSESPDPKTMFITRPFCDTIYKITGDSLYPAYQVVMPLENALPASFFTNPFKNKAEWDNFRQNNNWMFSQMYQFRETPAYFIFSAAFLYNWGAYIYDKKKQIAYQTSKIKADSSTFHVDVIPGSNIDYKDGYFYKVLTPESIRESYKPVAGKQAPAAIEAIVNKKSNAAILAVLTLKN